MSSSAKPIVGIIGGRLASTTPQAMQLAERAGEELGKRGVAIICGGEDGIMEAACKGCKRVGGTTFGVLKGKDKRAANRYVDYAILTSMDLARNNIIVWSAAGLIAFDGMFGTLSEIGLALDIGKPLILMGGNRLIDISEVKLRTFAHYEGYNVEQVAKAVDHLFRMIKEYEI